MQVKEVMIPDVAVIDQEASLLEASKQLREVDSDRLIVASGEQPVGQLTEERLEAMKTGKSDLADTPVAEAMQKHVVGCYEETDVRDAADLMRSQRVKEAPVVNRYSSLVGRVRLDDLPASAAR